MFASWLDESNLVPWLEIVAGLASYGLSPADVDAVTYGLRDTDTEAGSYSAYELHGGSRIQFELGLDPETSVIRVRVEAPDALIPRINTATDICASYWLASGPPGAES